ncbi:PucR family transcriptional regulator [Salinifilum ghardaiensis]
MTSAEFLPATVPLRAFVDRDDLGAVLLAGADEALERPVRWAHVSELTDPVPYLLGGELLLCCGVELVPGPQPTDDYVRGLVGAGVTALGFGVTPVFDAVPPALIDACRRHGLPLLEIPERTPFLAVCRTVGEELNTRAQASLRRLTEAQRALTAAAARPAPRTGVLRELGRCVGGWAEVVEPSSPVPDAVHELAERVRTGVASAATELADGTQVVAQPVGPRVLTVGKPGRFDGTDRAVIAVGLALLSVVAGQVASASLGSLATALLSGAGASESLLDAVFGRRGGQYRVVAAEAGASLDGLATPLVGEDGRTAIVDTDIDVSHVDGLLAVSGPHPAGELPEAARQARQLLDRARSVGRSLHAEHAGTGFASAVRPAAARVFADEVLAPLDGHPQLLEALRTWLSQHGSWDRTAAALGVHRNSVRHRIGRVERLLTADLADPQVRMELWFALQWRTP